MPGSTNGAPFCGKRKTCRRCCRRSSPSMPGTNLSVLQHAPWIGRLFAASILRQAGITTGAHLAAINLGLKTIPVDRRRHRDRETRLLAIAHGLIAAAEIGHEGA